MCFYEGAKIVVVANLPTGPAIGHGDYRRFHILYECDVSRGHKLQSWWVFKRKRTLFAEATAAVPDQFADEVSLCGPVDRIKDRLQAWRETPVTSLLLGNSDPETMQTMAELVLS